MCCSQAAAWPRLPEDSAEDADFDFTGDGRPHKELPKWQDDLNLDVFPLALHPGSM